MDTGSGFPSENYRQMLSLLFYLFFLACFVIVTLICHLSYVLLATTCIQILVY